MIRLAAQGKPNFDVPMELFGVGSGTFLIGAKADEVIDEAEGPWLPFAPTAETLANDGEKRDLHLVTLRCPSNVAIGSTF